MQLFVIIPLIVSLIVASIGHANRPTPDAQQRAQELAALFNKSKHKVKDKHGVHLEINVDVTNQPVVKPAGEFAGEYTADDTFSIRLTAGSGGEISLSGTEPDSDETVSFTVRDARLDGAVLTGAKVYQNGTSEKFEGVFLRRTVHTDQGEPDETVFGLGVVFDPPKPGGSAGCETNKLFYEVR